MVVLVTIRMVVLAALHPLCFLSHCVGMAAKREKYVCLFSMVVVVVGFVHSIYFVSFRGQQKIYRLLLA